MSEKQLSFDCAMQIVGEERWIHIKDIERLVNFIQSQQATIESLERKLDYFQKRTIDLGEQVDYAKDENNELKDKLDNIRKEVINVDMFSDEALNHDIIAYREMHTFDNKDCYAIACAINKIKRECFR